MAGEVEGGQRIGKQRDWDLGHMRTFYSISTTINDNNKNCRSEELAMCKYCAKHFIYIMQPCKVDIVIRILGIRK